MLAPVFQFHDEITKTDTKALQGTQGRLDARAWKMPKQNPEINKKRI
jgi:hypothetical protein